jgi:tmRNA-binding protein
MGKEKDSFEKAVATNRKAYHDYFVEEKFEAGIMLQGTEVKSLRDGRVNLQDSYASVKGGEAFLHHCHISPYSHGNLMNHEPLRTRKLLLHRKEINKLHSFRSVSISRSEALPRSNSGWPKARSSMTDEPLSRAAKPAARWSGR